MLRLLREIEDPETGTTIPAGPLSLKQEGLVLELHRSVREDLRRAEERYWDLKWMLGAVARGMESDMVQRIACLKERLAEIEAALVAEYPEYPVTRGEKKDGSAK